MAEVREIISSLPPRQVLPPATPEELTSIEHALRRPIPHALRAALSVTSGLDLAYPLLMNGTGSGQVTDPLCPHELCLLPDGFGNSWNLDCDAPPSDQCRILFACHDPPVIFLHGHDIAEFLLFALGKGEPPELHEKRLLEFREPGTVIQNGVVRVARKGERLRCDLTTGRPGDGFWWADSSADFAARRLGSGPVFEVWTEAT